MLYSVVHLTFCVCCVSSSVAKNLSSRTKKFWIFWLNWTLESARKLVWPAIHEPLSNKTIPNTTKMQELNQVWLTRKFLGCNNLEDAESTCWCLGTECCDVDSSFREETIPTINLGSLVGFVIREPLKFDYLAFWCDCTIELGASCKHILW